MKIDIFRSQNTDDFFIDVQSVVHLSRKLMCVSAEIRIENFTVKRCFLSSGSVKGPGLFFGNNKIFNILIFSDYFSDLYFTVKDSITDIFLVTSYLLSSDITNTQFTVNQYEFKPSNTQFKYIE